MEFDLTGDIVLLAPEQHQERSSWLWLDQLNRTHSFSTEGGNVLLPGLQNVQAQYLHPVRCHLHHVNQVRLW